MLFQTLLGPLARKLLLYGAICLVNGVLGWLILHRRKAAVPDDAKPLAWLGFVPVAGIVTSAASFSPASSVKFFWQRAQLQYSVLPSSVQVAALAAVSYTHLTPPTT